MLDKTLFLLFFFVDRTTKKLYFSEYITIDKTSKVQANSKHEYIGSAGSCVPLVPN